MLFSSIATATPTTICRTSHMQSNPTGFRHLLRSCPDLTHSGQHTGYSLRSSLFTLAGRMGITSLKQHSNSHTCTQPVLEEALCQSKVQFCKLGHLMFKDRGEGKSISKNTDATQFLILPRLAQVSSPSRTRHPVRLGRDPHLCHLGVSARRSSTLTVTCTAYLADASMLSCGIPAREGSLQAAAPKLSIPVARLLRREPAQQRQVATGQIHHSPAARCLQSHLTECKTKIKTFFSLTLRTVCYIICVCI